MNSREVQAARGAERPSQSGLEHYKEKLQEWQKAPSIQSAGQLVGAAFSHARVSEASDAARLVLSKPGSVSSTLEWMASEILDRTAMQEQLSERPGAMIREARHRLSVHPLNGLAWLDLALGLSGVGKLAEAERAIAVATDLAPENRIVLRSAARFWVHVDRPDRAHDLLVQTPVAREDPWLIAAEIAVSRVAQQPPRFVRRARELLRNDRLPPWQTNELAASLGSLEFNSGSVTRGRRLLRKALRDASDNTVAQVRYENKSGLAVDLSPEVLQLFRGFEARAWTAWERANWEESATEAEHWLRDEPFSSRPAELASFVSAVALEDHSRSIVTLRAALKANPEEVGILNNLAYSLALSGRTAEAERYLSTLKPLVKTKKWQATYSATLGLLRYCQNRVNEGRSLYRSALDGAAHLGDTSFLKKVWLFWALQEVKHSADQARTILERVSALPVSDQIDGVLVERVLSRIENRLRLTRR